MPNPIRIVADLPTETPGLGFSEYVEALADTIRHGEPAQFTIGLYGAWGSGKSSLLKAVERTLSEDGSDVLPVFFDAWRHERAEHIVVPLLYRISEAAQSKGYEALTQHLRRALDALLFSLRFSVPGVSMDTRAIRERWAESGPTPLDEAFAKPFEELQKLPATLGSRRVAVLVDDLDRCSSNKVVGLLEAINLVMDIKGFIFVLALDYDVLIDAVAERYPHVSGHEFIEKMVQLPFRVPALTIGEKEFGELIPNWAERREAFPDGLAETVVAVSDLGLRSNPRQIKRLINSLLLIERIVDRRDLDIDHELLATMIGLQLRWPADYRALQDAVLADDDEKQEEQFDAMRKSEDMYLATFAKRFFKVTPGGAALRGIFRLTAVVAERPPDVDELSRRYDEAMLEDLESLFPGQVQRARTGVDAIVTLDGVRVGVEVKAGPRVRIRSLQWYKESDGGVQALLFIVNPDITIPDELREYEKTSTTRALHWSPGYARSDLADAIQQLAREVQGRQVRQEE